MSSSGTSSLVEKIDFLISYVDAIPVTSSSDNVHSITIRDIKNLASISTNEIEENETKSDDNNIIERKIEERIDKIDNCDISFYRSKHLAFILKLQNIEDSYEYCQTEHLRMQVLYWALCALALLDEIDSIDKIKQKEMIEFVLNCFDDESGGFGGNLNHDPHLLNTLSAIQILLLLNKNKNIYQILPLNQIIKIVEYIKSLQKSDGSFTGDKWGEVEWFFYLNLLCKDIGVYFLKYIFYENKAKRKKNKNKTKIFNFSKVDTRFTYAAVNGLSLLGGLSEINKEKCIEFLIECRNFDGGFGTIPYAESHSGMVFCCVGSLAILDSLSEVDIDVLNWWLCERQVKSKNIEYDGGLNGRPEKLSDTCYSWWVLSAMSICNKIHWINSDKLTKFILLCQDKDDGGISDRPSDLADIYHTYFGIAGLSLLNKGDFKLINPVWALPEDLLLKCNILIKNVKDNKNEIDHKWIWNTFRQQQKNQST